MPVTPRPTRHDMLMQIAHVVASRSTCDRLNVGAVLSREGRVLSMGYNGPASGLPHCAHENGEPCDAAIHAEANAITWAARDGIRIVASDLYVTHMPCLGCAKLIAQAGIRRVIFQSSYRDRAGLDLLTRARVGFVSYDPTLSGGGL